MRGLTVIAGLLMMGSAARAADIGGVWITDDGEGAVRIERCTEGLCGRIVWLKMPTGDDGGPARDDNNPDAALRERPLCGLTVLTGLRPDGEDWEGGSIYDPDTGSRYALAVAMRGTDRLALTGYIGIRMLGRTVEWRRAPAGMTPCVALSGPEAPAPKRPSNRP